MRLLLLLCCMIAVPTGAQSPPLAGSFGLVGRQGAEQSRDAAIEIAIEDMFIGSNIARRRLAAATPVPRRVEVNQLPDGQLRVHIVGAYDLRARADGMPFAFEDAFGYEHTARLYARPNMLVITLRGHGDCRIELRFSADRSRLRYRMRIHSNRLPADVRYEARYARR